MNDTLLACRVDTTHIASAVDAVRGIGWAHLRAALLLGVLAWTFTMLMELPRIVAFVTPFPVVVAQRLLDFELRTLCLMLAIVIADRAVDEGAGRFATYALAAVAACLAGVLLGIVLDLNSAVIELAAHDPNTDGAPAWQQYGTKLTNTIFSTLNWLLLGGSAVFLHADRRAAKKTEAYLRSAELDRIRRAKLAIESRLQAMQARVEPQFLFSTLTQVGELYARDPAAGAQMLDDLIAYLRAAMPRMRDTSSTLEQEIALVQAYLGIVKSRLADRLVIHVDPPNDAGSMHMPPMMLLPLIAQAIAPGVDLAGSEAELRIHCSVGNGRLCLSVVTIGFVRPGEGEAAAIRERLDALYGSNARLVVRSDAPLRIETTIEIPCEREAPAGMAQIQLPLEHTAPVA